jgi:hypothetical protein
MATALLRALRADFLAVAVFARGFAGGRFVDGFATDFEDGFAVGVVDGFSTGGSAGCAMIGLDILIIPARCSALQLAINSGDASI